MITKQKMPICLHNQEIIPVKVVRRWCPSCDPTMPRATCDTEQSRGLQCLQCRVMLGERAFPTTAQRAPWVISWTRDEIKKGSQYYIMTVMTL